ncbi:MAG: dephospho-CoA kinase [Bdellovibrionales bacterium]|nr:dephospho-CoA kinase [Bdellovibrionales bacterium]
MANRNFLVGITGGMGAGKSTVSDLIRQAGYPVLSADAIARAITSPGAPAFDAVVALFGKQVVTLAGDLDRTRIREEISRSPELRRKLEAITHPLIQRESARLAAEEFSRGAQAVFYEAPLLFEANSEGKMDAVICVVAGDDLRASRIAQRDGVSLDAARRLMNAQMPQQEKAARSRWVVENNGTEAALAARVREVLEEVAG